MTATMEQEAPMIEGALTLENPSDHGLILATFTESELFSVEVSINPLVAAAQPLLSIISRLNLTRTIQKPLELKQQIENEFNVFTSRVQEDDYGHEIVLVARYLLSAVLDEMFSKLEWQSINDYLCIGRFTPKANEGCESDERFFLIVEKMFENPNEHLELLELAYLCISFGFEGKYRAHANKREQLDFILDRLYEIVKRQRAPERLHLLISANKLREQNPGLRPLSITSLVITVLLIVSLSFAGLNLLLGKQIAQESWQVAQHTPKTEKVAHG